MVKWLVFGSNTEVKITEQRVFLGRHVKDTFASSQAHIIC